MHEFRIEVPRGFKPSPEWRTRFRAIEADLANGESGLRRGMEEAYRLAQEEGELAAVRRLEQIRQESLNLFPGEAGQRLLWSILCGASPFLWERDRGQPARLPDGTPNPNYYARRNVFEQPTLDDPAPPRYRSGAKEPGRRRAYAARRTPETRGDVRAGIVKAGPDFEKLSELMEGDVARRIPPLTYPEIAKKFGITSTELHKELNRLRTRIGLTWIRSAEDQARYANVIGGMIRVALEDEKAGQTPNSPSQHPSQRPT